MKAMKNMKRGFAKPFFMSFMSFMVQCS